MAATWIVRLTRQAEQDLEDILTFTLEHFGLRQVEIYAEALTLALETLVNGPDIIGAVNRDDILPDIKLLHLARFVNRGRHFVVFRAQDNRHIDVLRILHDSMDLDRHL